MVEAPASWKVHASLRFRNSCKFSPCNHNAGTADQRYVPKQAFSTHTVDSNVIKGLGYSQNRRVSGQRLCLLILQISISVDHDVPAFSKAGTFFLLRYLKKAEKCPLYSRGLWGNIAQLFPDKRRKHVRVLYERKIFRATP